MKEKVLNVLEEYNDELVEDLERNLLSEEILDSFDIVKLVVELEDAFDISIDVDAITPESFRTVNDIIALVERFVEE